MHMHHLSRTALPRSAFALALACCIVLAGLLPPTARAATFTVTKTDDTFDDICDADCSLRDAIRAANANPGADTIALPPGVYGLILGSAGDDEALGGDLDILESVTIEGAGAAETVIRGGATWGDRIFQVFASANVSINGVTIREGHAGAGSGGAISNQGTLALTRSAVAGSTASAGGGIANQGTLTLTDSTVSGNTATESTNGGGILNQGTLAATNSTISNNTASSGGGIANTNTATLSSVTISANTASSGSGGGILNQGALALKNSLIADNNGATSPDCAGPLTSQGYNLIGALGGCAFSAAAGDLTNVEAQLGPLRDNDGPTLTHGLFPGSPAIDAGSPIAPGSGGSACPTKDQRNYPRPQTGRCDIGAFEPVGVSIVDFSFQLPTVAVRTGDTLRWKNLGASTHTTHADNNPTEFWVSPALQNGDVFLHTFLTSGVYDYHCSIHPSMTGTILVQGSPANKVPVLTRLDPASAPVGSPALQVILSGTNFAEDAVVHWNGVALPPDSITSVAPDQIIIEVPAELLTTAGKAKVTVVNPGASGGVSNALTFTIGVAGQNPLPLISGISPTVAAVGGGPITLTITGSNFVSGATVQWGTVTLTPTLVTNGQIVVVIPPELLATIGIVNIVVVNPGPGGGPSNAVPFLVARRPIYLPLVRQ